MTPADHTSEAGKYCEESASGAMNHGVPGAKHKEAFVTHMLENENILQSIWDSVRNQER